MYGPGGIENFKNRVDLAPPVDAAGRILNSDYLNKLSDQLFPGEHIYTIVKGWQDNPPTRDIVKMGSLKTRLENAKTTNPQAQDAVTQSAIDQLIRDIDTMLGAPPVPRPPESAISKEILDLARNQFEEFLLTKGFPPSEILKTDEPSLEYKRSFALTAMLQGVRSMDWPNLVAPSPMSIQYSSARFSTPLNGLQLIETATDGIPLGPDKKEVEKILGKTGEGRLRTDVLIIHEIFDFFKMLKEPLGGGLTAQQSAEKLVEIYTKIKTSNMFDKDRIKLWGELPTLLKEDMVTPEGVSLGQLFFTTFKEILTQGRDWDTTNPRWPRSKRNGVKAQVVDPKHRNERAYINIEEHEPITILAETVPTPSQKHLERDEDRSLFPEQDAGGSTDVKSRALRGLRYIASKAAKAMGIRQFGADRNKTTRELMAEIAADPDTKTSLTADVATMLAYHLAVITGESEFEDAVGNRPVGKNIFARLAQAFLYAQKTNSEAGSESKTNMFIIGRVLAYVRTFLKFGATADGKTLEQAVMSSEKWQDLDVSTMPDSMTQRWADHILQGFGEYMRGEHGLKGGAIFKIAELNFAEGRVVVNQEIIKNLHDMLRFSWEYYIQRDQVPSAIYEDWDKKEITLLKQPNGQWRRNVDEPMDPTAMLPSEEFTMITVADHDGNIIYEPYDSNKKLKPFITRMPKTMLMNPWRLGEWILADQGAKSGGGPGVDGKGYIPEKTGFIEHRVLDAAGNPTGQVWQELVIRLKPGANTAEEIKDAHGHGTGRYNFLNRPSQLARRLLIEYTLSLVAMPGDTVSALKKEDIIPLGIFLSKEMRENYLKGGYAGFLQPASAALGELMHKAISGWGEIAAEFLQREDPGIYGLPMFSEEQYFQLLSRMGWKLSSHDWQTMFGHAKALVLGGKASTAGKH